MKFFNMTTQIEKIDFNSIERANKILTEGGIVAIPTETVYGLGAIATNPQAVMEIFRVKGRPSDNPLIAHVHKDYDICKLVHIRQDYVYDLIKAFTPGPLTLVFESKGVVCEQATCGGDTLAIRIPSHQGCQQLLKRVDAPIVAPSANLSKHTSPVTANHVYNDLNGKIQLILDGGKCTGGIESTVLDVTGKIPRILRAGLVTKEMIESVVGRCEIALHKEGDKIKSPGVKYKHYQPNCKTALFEYGDLQGVLKAYDEEIKLGGKPFIMCSDEFISKLPNKNLLSLGNTPQQIACNLYDKLLEGEKKATLIIAISMKDENGINMGIMNRLRKSCG